MKKILILSNSASGLYEFRNELVQNLLGANEVYISLPESEDDRYMIAFKNEGCHVLSTPFERRGMNPLKDYELLKAYKQLIKEISPDMVLTYTIKPNIYGGLACKGLKVPYMTNITGLGTAILGGGILSKALLMMYRAATSRARCIFFQNSSNMEYMTKCGIKGGGDIKLLPGSGVNLSAHPYMPYPSEDNGIEILSVMRIMKDKGIEELLDTIEIMGSAGDGSSDESDNHMCSDSSRRIHFTIAGSYEEETRSVYEPRIEKLTEEGKLTYLGFIDDMNPIYAGSHIIVHPSYHEGLSNVCLEAAACGRPVVTTDIPGCRETVTIGKQADVVSNEDYDNAESQKTQITDSGILCQPRSVDSLKDALENMLEMTSEEHEKMGRMGRKHIEENFDRNLVIRAYREYI